ncbi:hypothetical protein HaLaN_12719, partial [Haematococcus lacustris]
MRARDAPTPVTRQETTRWVLLAAQCFKLLQLAARFKKALELLRKIQDWAGASKLCIKAHAHFSQQATAARAKAEAARRHILVDGASLLETLADRGQQSSAARAEEEVQAAEQAAASAARSARTYLVLACRFSIECEDWEQGLELLKGPAAELEPGVMLRGWSDITTKLIRAANMTHKLGKVGVARQLLHVTPACDERDELLTNWGCHDLLISQPTVAQASQAFQAVPGPIWELLSSCCQTLTDAGQVAPLQAVLASPAVALVANES